MSLPPAELFKRTLSVRGGETGRMIASRPWSGTQLGAIEAWPQSLRTAVGIMATTRHPVFIFWGPDLVCLYNDAFAASLGPDKHPAILGMPAPAAFPEAYPLVASDIAQVMAGGEPTWAENTLVPITRHGRLEEVYWTYSYGPILDSDAPRGVGGVLTFITETTQTVRAQQRSEERYQTLFKSIDDGFCVIEIIFDDENRPRDYRFVEVNPAFEGQTGLQNATGKLVRELVPDLEQHWFDIYGRVALTGEAVQFEHPAKSLDDRWFDVYAFRVGGGHSRQVGILFSDITGRRRAEAALRDEEARFRQMADAVPQIAWITDAQGKVEFFNKQWASYTGASRQPATAAEASQLYVHPDDVSATVEAFEAARRTEDTFQIEHRIRSRSGEYRWFLVRAEPYRDPTSGQVIRWFGASTDIHDRKEAEERQSFLLRLDDRLRAITDPVEVTVAAAEMLGRHLSVARAGYGELDAKGELIKVERDWARGLPSLAGESRLVDGFGAAIAAELRAGTTLRVDDCTTDPRAVGAGVAETWASIQLRAIVAVPLVKEARLTAFLYLHEPAPRAWTKSEVTLAQKVAERSWAALERARAEALLRESEARLTLAAEVAGFGTYQYDMIDDRHTWSPQTYRIFGLEPGTPLAIGMVNELIHPDDRAASDARIATAMAQGETELTVEHRIVRPDGAVRHVVLRSRLEYAPGVRPLRPLRIVGAVQDVTALREAERELHALVASRTAERDRIWQLSPDLMCVARVDGTLLSVNPAWERLLGWSAAWLTGRNAAEIKHPEDASRTAAELARLAAGGYRTSNFEDRYRAKDGRWFWISWVCEPEGDLIYCIGRDVTAERTAHDALADAEAARREADALYRAYFENTAEALFVVGVEQDGGFTLEELNPAHEAATGLSTATMKGKRLGDQLAPEIADAVAQNYRRAVSEKRPIAYREVLDLPAGTRHWDTVLVPVQSQDGDITRIVGSARDITAQVLAEEQLRQSQKMEAVGQLTGGLAHDFNNLLGAVVGSFDLIRRRSGDEERVRRYAEAGLQAAERGAKLTGQLLAFSRAQRLEQRPVVVSDLVAGMRDMLDRALGPLVRLDLKLEGDGAVLSDPIQLEMALLNLAINARDAMPSGGNLTIRTCGRSLNMDHELGSGDYVELSVEDTGTGMPPAVRARAFDPFFTTKGVGKGTGLGLSQVYGVAKQSGGTVRIESQEGTGTTVRILLPRTAKPAAPEETAPTGAATPYHNAALVLVIDDDPDVRHVLVNALEALGYRTVEAEDGPSGLAALEEHGPDLVMLDFAMPGMNGAEVARAAQERRPDLPIVFASGYADTAAIEAVAGRHATLLRKPFRVADLEAVLVDALQNGHRSKV